MFKWLIAKVTNIFRFTKTDSKPLPEPVVVKKIRKPATKKVAKKVTKKTK